MILSFLRDKILTFVLPVLLVAGILGGIIWLVGKVYFWDTARLTLTLPTDTAQVKMTIQVPLVHKDINLFGFFSYPIHFILPWSRTQDCKQTCVFDRIPAGDALVVMMVPSSTTQFRVFIEPDTDGSLDLRPDFTMVPLVDEKKLATLRSSPVSDKELALLPALRYENRIQGVYLLDQAGERKLYDATTKQILPLPVSPEIA